MEAADWLERLVKYIPHFASLVNLGCTPERPKEPGKQQTWIINYIHSLTWDAIIHSYPNFNERLTKPPPMTLGHG